MMSGLTFVASGADCAALSLLYGANRDCRCFVAEDLSWAPLAVVATSSCPQTCDETCCSCNWVVSQAQVLPADSSHTPCASSRNLCFVPWACYLMHLQ